MIFSQRVCYRVLTASSAETALKVLAHANLDTVLTDYQIGKTTAEKVIPSIRSLKPKIPIILFSEARDLPQELHVLAERIVHKTEIGVLAKELARMCEKAVNRQ